MNDCSVTEFQHKEVICSKTGCRLGYVCDAQIDICTGRITALMICTKSRYGVFAKDELLRISWEDIDVIGDDTILICKQPEKHMPEGKKSLFEGLFKS